MSEVQHKLKLMTLADRLTALGDITGVFIAELRTPAIRVARRYRQTLADDELSADGMETAQVLLVDDFDRGDDLE